MFVRRRRYVIRLRRTFVVLFCLAVCEVIFFCVVASSSKQTVARVRVETDSKALYFLRRLPRNVLFVEPFHGLGNRLRAYACAAALAKFSGLSPSWDLLVPSCGLPCVILSPLEAIWEHVSARMILALNRLRTFRDGIRPIFEYSK